MDGGDDPKGTLFDLHPMAWFLVPGSIFVASMAALVFVRWRRRRRRVLKEKWGGTLPTTNNPSAAAMPSNSRQWPHALATDTTNTTTTTTPTWAERARNMTRFKRRDDGLNEYGEAPPTYMESTHNSKARPSMSTSTASSVPRGRASGGPAPNIAPPMGSVSIPMPGGPPTFYPHGMGADYLGATYPLASPNNARSDPAPSQPQPAALR